MSGASRSQQQLQYVVLSFQDALLLTCFLVLGAAREGEEQGGEEGKEGSMRLDTML
jgi:hypothetical protein